MAHVKADANNLARLELDVYSQYENIDWKKETSSQGIDRIAVFFDTRLPSITVCR